ncbi:MAG: precorrin-6Y C5,15-methyltransferase (decarboxylating) subunit CbiT [Candidatus Bathyarchaeota archaeon]|nr:precorrin-6Y C5,15-methyltransferase (decarboxylating) subunit CbiT [Candidatus Bathyarchaeota archaeon]
MWTYKTPGIPDSMFIQDEAVPGPTKEEIRALTISKARLKEGFSVIDVGCGTGGLTVEAAFQVAPTGKVFAIDEDKKAVELTKINVAKFNLQNTVQVINGQAPEALLSLPMVDAILVGGSRALRELLRSSYQRLKKNGRLVVNAILLETSYTALDEMKKLGFREIEVITVFVAKGQAVSSGTMMMARNPITILSATRV